MDKVEDIRSLILKNKKPSYNTTNRKEVRVRCPYCGDSQKNKTHAHMYIEIKPPFKFYCQRCSTSGVLNQQTLRDLDIYNNDLSMNIIETNKTIKNTDNIYKPVFNKKNIKLTKEETSFSKNALDYFQWRFNKSFTNDYIVDKFRAITNSAKFFEENYIQVPHRYGKPMYDFDNSIGFLSSDGSHAIFRDITNQQAKRYFNFNLYNDEESPSGKIFNIKSSVDIMADEINLVLTEGVFDIVGVYEHLYRDKVDMSKNNYIFAAAAGKGYNAVINHYIRMGFLNLNVTIYSDADVNVWFYRDLKNYSPYLKNIPLTIYYNTLEKDYGVPEDKIKLKKAIV
jgi:hypothetical protein